MTSNHNSTNPFDEIPELTGEAARSAFYVNPDGLCQITAWVDYEVFCWLEQLHGDWDDNMNEILKEKMQRAMKK